MDCKTASELLPLYFDGELDRATGRELEAHLDGCAHCRELLIGLDTLRSRLRDDASRHMAPDLLRARIRKEISQRTASMPTTTPLARRPRTNWLALTASWVIMFAAGSVLVPAWRHSPSADDVHSQIARDLFAGHWRALAANSPFDVVSTDQHTVKPWFAGKIAVAPVVQDFAAEGYALVGGRIDYVGNERVPVLVYRHGHHLIDVFVLSQDDAAPLGKPIRSQGYVMETVMLGDRPAAIVSDMGDVELSRFLQLLGSAR